MNYPQTKDGGFITRFAAKTEDRSVKIYRTRQGTFAEAARSVADQYF